MDINEIERLVLKIVNFNCYNNEIVTKDIKKIFSEFSQSNKSDLEGGKGLDRFVNGEISEVEIFVDGINIAKIFQRMLDKEIEGMKGSISELDERIDNRGDSLDNKIGLLETEIEALKKQNDTLFKFVPHAIKKEEPKQERFYYYMHIDNKIFSREMYAVVDRKNIIRFNNFYYYGDAVEICQNMNSMEGK